MSSLALVLLLLIVGIAPMVWEASHNRFDPFNLKNPFIAYYLLQLGVSWLVTLASGRPSPIGLDPSEFKDAFVRALGLAIIGLLAFHGGYYTQRSVPLRLPRVFAADWKGRRYRLLAAGYLVIGAFTFVLFLRVNGGLVTFLENREAFRSGGLVGQGVLTFPAGTIPAVAALVYFLGSAAGERRRRSPFPSVALLSLALVPAYIMGFRSAIGLPVIQLAVLWHYCRNRLSSATVLVVVVSLAVGFTIYGIQRSLPPRTALSDAVELARAALAQDPELAYSAVSRSKGLEVVAAVLERLRHTQEFDLGYRSLLEAATIVVPRALWKSKPQPSSVRFTTYFFGDALASVRNEVREEWGGISPTVVGELYWHFGVAGVIFGLYLLGRIARIAFATRSSHPANKSVQLAYAIFYTSFAMFAEAIQGYLNGLVMFSIVLVGSAAMLSAVVAHGVTRTASGTSTPLLKESV